MSSNHFGKNTCAICLDPTESTRKFYSDAIRVLFETNMTGIDGEILIPRGFQCVHKKCFEFIHEEDAI